MDEPTSRYPTTRPIYVCGDPVNRLRNGRLSRWVWAAWLALVAASFAALETYSLATDTGGDTLSETIRYWLGIDPAAPWRPLGIAGFSLLLLGFTAWFYPHIVARWGWWQPFKRRTDEEDS